MKLLRLTLHEPFRSLQAGFELNFLPAWDREVAIQSPGSGVAPYILAGPNGSGKSDVLEVLAAIFYHMECLYLENLPASFVYDEEQNPDGYQGRLGIPNAFELEYLIRPESELVLTEGSHYAQVKIAKHPKQSPQWFLLNGEEQPADQPWTVSRPVARDLLPSHILGYSSGENEVLSLPFFKMRFIHFDEYRDRLLNQLDYDGKPEGRLVYLDSAFSQAILICNLLMQEPEVLRPFAEEVGVEAIQSFRIILRKASGVDEEGEFVELKSTFEAEEVVTDTTELTEYLNPNIDALKKCATCYFETDDGELYLDYLVTEASREAFRLHFGSPLELFQVFQILLTLNLYTVSTSLKKELYTSNSLYVSETVPVLASDQRSMRFKDVDLQKQSVSGLVTLKSLSDGEHQFLHALGLCLLYRDDNALFRLDEPETHFNPAWRAQFISRLRECFTIEDGASPSPEILITTHAPFLISDSEPQQVLVFDKQDNIVTVERPDYNTLGASINQITLKTFNKRETIGGYAQQQMDRFKQRFEVEKDHAGAQDLQILIDDINHKLGDSVEKVLLVKTILDAMERSDKEKN